MSTTDRESEPTLHNATIADGRYIYNGDVLNAPGTTVPVPNRRGLRKGGRRKHSTFNVVSGLFLLATVSLLYTGNVIAVNQLMREVNDLNNRSVAIASANEVLKAEIARKSSLDRISTMASQELGLTNPKEPPVWFEIDEDELQVAEKE